MRGRYKESDKASQTLEIRGDEMSNAITTVSKDSLVCEMVKRECGAKRGVCKMNGNIDNYREESEPNFDTVKIKVSLNKITDIVAFVQLSSICVDDVMVGQGKWTVSAKSFMGVMCLDLTKPITVTFYGDIPSDVKEGMKDFMIEGECN